MVDFSLARCVWLDNFLLDFEMTTISRDDAHQMFSGCLVEHDDKLAFVRDIVDDGDDFKLAICYLGSRTNTLVEADPDKILCPTTPYRLGYVQLTDGECAYLSRSPARQYKVGWCEGNVNNFSVTALRRMGATLQENLRGVYLSFNDAYEKAKATQGRVAFDRMFAIDSRGVIHYKGNGICYYKDGVADLGGQGKESLRPLLNKAMGV